MLVKKFESKRRSKTLRDRKNKFKVKRKLFCGPDENYGDDSCQIPDLDSEAYESNKRAVLDKLIENQNKYSRPIIVIIVALSSKKYVNRFKLW